MKKVLLLLIILFPLPVLALEEINFDCPQNIAKDTPFTCQVTAKTDYEVSAIDLRFSLDNELLEKEEFRVDAIWEGDEEDDIVLVYTDENKIDNFKIGTLTLQAKEDLANVDIKITSAAFYDANYNEHLLDLKKDVNENVKSETNIPDKKNNNFKYVIISIVMIIITMTLIMIYILLKRKKNGVV